VVSASAWSATVFTAASGARLDQATATGASGSHLAVTLTRIADPATTCVTALTALVSKDTHVVENPAYLAGSWFTRAVANAGGSFICLPLAGGVLMGSVSPLATALEETQVRALLIGIRLAAFERWGAAP
jgi:hypothetical protein